MNQWSDFNDKIIQEILHIFKTRGFEINGLEVFFGSIPINSKRNTYCILNYCT